MICAIKQAGVNFFTKNPLNNNPQILVSVIKNSSELRKSLLSNMNNYIITENDIFQRFVKGGWN